LPPSRTGALLRAIPVGLLVATPSVLLPGIGIDGRETAALIALLAGLLIYAEYTAASPGMIDFRDAPPINRVRFAMLFACVFLLTAIARDQVAPNALTGVVHGVALAFGQAIDVPLGPVRLMTLGLEAFGRGDVTGFARVAAGMGFIVAILAFFAFVLVLRNSVWPVRSGAFNIWVNLPTFDPLAGDMAERLDRDARVNLVLGIAMPFLIPVGVGIGLEHAPQALSSPQALIWVMAAWAFIPTSLVMRAIALARVAELVCEKRRLQGAYGRQAGLAMA
jgi:hypothetical protein